MLGKVEVLSVAMASCFFQELRLYPRRAFLAGGAASSSGSALGGSWGGNLFSTSAWRSALSDWKYCHAQLQAESKAWQ